MSDLFKKWINLSIKKTRRKYLSLLAYKTLQTLLKSRLSGISIAIVDPKKSQTIAKNYVVTQP